MYQRRLSLLTCAASLLGSTAVFADTMPCKEIHWQPYQAYTIKSSLHQRTHIILPEPIQGTPVPGSPQLWDVDGENIHLFIKPKNFGNAEGGKTTVTAITKSNASYDFVVHRVKTGADICVRIVQDNFAANGATQGWQSDVERQNENLAAQVRFAQAQVASERTAGDQRTLDALHEYRANVYTRYSWKGGSGFFSSNQITDVWDDGRWTYVRLNTDNKGLMQVTAIVEGKEEIIEYDYDSDKKLYSMAGLYPEFVLRYDKSKITVSRDDAKTNGSY